MAKKKTKKSVQDKRVEKIFATHPELDVIYYVDSKTIFTSEAKANASNYKFKKVKRNG